MVHLWQTEKIVNVHSAPLIQSGATFAVDVPNVVSVNIQTWRGISMKLFKGLGETSPYELSTNELYDKFITSIWNEPKTIKRLGIWRCVRYFIMSQEGLDSWWSNEDEFKVVFEYIKEKIQPSKKEKEEDLNGKENGGL